MVSKKSRNQVIVSNGLVLENISWSYEKDPQIGKKPGNEGAVGGMRIACDVISPDNTVDIRISTWKSGMFTESEIKDNIEHMIQIWKAIPVYERSVPFHTNSSFPVWDKDLGKTYNVLFLGLDINGDCTGYAVLPVKIPI